MNMTDQFIYSLPKLRNLLLEMLPTQIILGRRRSITAFRNRVSYIGRDYMNCFERRTSCSGMVQDDYDDHFMMALLFVEEL